MGLTFVAAGVSVPDALSSIAVIKEGYVIRIINIYRSCGSASGNGKK